jgi:hypothetical protein
VRRRRGVETQELNERREGGRLTPLDLAEQQHFQFVGRRFGARPVA